MAHGTCRLQASHRLLWRYVHLLLQHAMHTLATVDLPTAVPPLPSAVYPMPTTCPLPLPSLPAGTEIAGSFLTGSPLQPQAPSTFSTPAIGHCPVIIAQQADGAQALSVHGDGAGGAAAAQCWHVWL